MPINLLLAVEEGRGKGVDGGEFGKGWEGSGRMGSEEKGMEGRVERRN